MHYQEIIPGSRLKQYVKCYYSYESDSAVAFEDTVFPSGCMEIIFNLGSGRWQMAKNEVFENTPHVELWGQIVQPLPIRSIGQNTMLGIRFLPHGAACFLNEKADLFNHQVIDYRDVAGREANILYQHLLEAKTLQQRIILIDTYLLQKLESIEKKLDKLTVVNGAMSELKNHENIDNINNVAEKYGISSRYLQKLFLQYTGLTPKLYSKINRFQQSLKLVTKKDASLTSIAYDCGYFDQSHFIREFKSFTGLTPSGYAINVSPITVAQN